MDMMFVHDEGLRDERKTLIGFDRKLLIAGREKVLQLLFRELVLDDTCRKSLELELASSLLLTGVRGYRDLFDLWLR